MLPCFLLFFSIVLFQVILNVNPYPFEKFLINGAYYEQFFQRRVIEIYKMRYIVAMSNQLHVIAKPAMPLSGIFYSKFPILLPRLGDGIDLLEGWLAIPSAYIKCIQFLGTEPSDHCLEFTINLETFFSKKNEVIITFHWPELTAIDSYLTLRVFQFAFNMEPMIPPAIFVSEKKMVKMLLINDKKVNLKSLVSNDVKDTICLFSFPQDKFELLFEPNLNHVQCEGLLTPDSRKSDDMDYSWNTYHPHLPVYLLFQIHSDTSSNTATLLHQSFYVDFAELKSELMEQTLLFHLVCSHETGATLHSFQVNKKSSHLPSTHSYHHEPLLPIFNAVKISELVSPVILNQYVKVPNTNDLSLPPETITKELQYFIPISKDVREIPSELLESYANVGSSFVKEVYIFDKEVPMNALETEQVKRAEIDWQPNFGKYGLISYGLKLSGNSNFSVQVQAVIWPKEETPFETPVSTLFPPSFFTGTPSQPQYTVVNGTLHLENQLRDFTILKDIKGHKVELRFHVSNFTNFTTFRTYLNPLQSDFEPENTRSISAFLNMYDMKLQGKVLKVSQLQDSCYYAEIIDIVLEESVIDFSYVFYGDLDNTLMSFFMSHKWSFRHPYCSLHTSVGKVNFFKFYLDQEMLQVTYLEELDHQLINLHLHNPRIRHPLACIQARVHVPSYIYKLSITSHKEMRAMLHAFLSGSHRAFVESSKKLLSLVEFIYSKGGRVYYSEERLKTDYPHEFLTSYYLKDRPELHRLFFNALKIASRVFYLSLIGLDSDQQMLHYANVLQNFLFREWQNLQTKWVYDTFPRALDEFCNFISHSPKALSLYVQSIPSPRFQSLFPNRVYSEHEIPKAQLLSNLVTLCNYKKWINEALLAQQAGKNINRCLRHV